MRWILVMCCLVTASVTITAQPSEFPFPDPNIDPPSADACYHSGQRDPAAVFDKVLPGLDWAFAARIAKWAPTMTELLWSLKKLKSLTVGYAQRKPTKAEKKGDFSWEPDCPSTIHWLESYRYNNKTQCFVFVPSVQRIPYTKCNRGARCARTCAEDTAGSICVQNNFVLYNVWMYCPYQRPAHRSLVPARRCRRRPSRCAVKMLVLLPQSCDCYTCRSKAAIDSLNLGATVANGQ